MGYHGIQADPSVKLKMRSPKVIKTQLMILISIFQQPTWRFWGEEKVDGGIYTVYLKKVRYHTPSKSITNEDHEDDISHLEWETVRHVGSR